MKDKSGSASIEAAPTQKNAESCRTHISRQVFPAGFFFFLFSLLYYIHTHTDTPVYNNNAQLLLNCWKRGHSITEPRKKEKESLNKLTCQVK